MADQTASNGSDVPSSSPYAVSDDQAATITHALRDYLAETDRYLLSYRSWPTKSPHDPECCPSCRSLHLRWEHDDSSRLALVERRDRITTALAIFQ